MRIHLTQGQRALALFVDLLALFLISWVAFGTILPPVSERGFWFYTSLLSLLVGARLVSPFYVKPIDAVAYAVPAFTALMLVNNWSNWNHGPRIAFAAAVGVAGVIGGSGFVAVLLNGWNRENLQKISNSLRVLVEGVARPAIVYSPLLVFSMLAFHYQSPRELVGVAIAMLATTVLSAGEIGVRTTLRVRRTIGMSGSSESLGTIAAYQEPGIYLIRSQIANRLEFPTPLIVNDALTGLRVAYAIDTAGRENGHLCRAIDLGAASLSETASTVTLPAPDQAFLIDSEALKGFSVDTQNLVERYSQVVGLVDRDSSIQGISVDITSSQGIAAGRLIETEVAGQDVIYQIVAGSTREEAIYLKNTRGYQRAQAQQVGVWQRDRFSQCQWLPEMNAPVRLVAADNYVPTESTIGHFPQTNYGVEIGDLNQLVTHNTAILGILGVGKSMLAIELVERMLANGIKVVCLDLTNQYAQLLEEYYWESEHVKSLKTIREACEKDREASADNPEEGGSLPHFRHAVHEDLKAFLDNNNKQMLKIFNPADFAPTRQEQEPRSFQVGGQWRRGAGLYNVTPVQATQVISEAALDCLSGEMSEAARACLVYEEAHALIPEWNAVVADGDRQATSGTARAILQGRKYGLGCLVVTQRTANVTKSILNQCNTMFGMRTFDDTGKEFLSNYFGRDYAEQLSTLPERHAVFFGRGSSCENPVLLRLNDRHQFLRIFRDVNPVPPKPTGGTTALDDVQGAPGQRAEPKDGGPISA